jgi:hypothetical protein
MNAQELKVISEAVVLCILGITLFICLTVIALQNNKTNKPKRNGR